MKLHIDGSWNQCLHTLIYQSDLSSGFRRRQVDPLSFTNVYCIWHKDFRTRCLLDLLGKFEMWYLCMWLHPVHFLASPTPVHATEITSELTWLQSYALKITSELTLLHGTLFGAWFLRLIELAVQ